KSSDAHAWPEVWFKGLGWVAFEPTPGRFEPNPTNYTGTYNPTAGGAIASTTTTTVAGSSASTPSTPSRRPLKENDEALSTGNGKHSGWLSPWMLAAAGAVLFIGALLATPPFLKRRRRTRRRSTGTARTRVSGAWSEALDRLREVGTAPALSHTPME